MKACPYCAEEIQDAAIVCKHCGRDLVPGATPTPTPPVPQSSVPPGKAKKKTSPLAAILLLIIIVAVVAIAFSGRSGGGLPSGTPTPIIINQPAGASAGNYKITYRVTGYNDGVDLTYANEDGGTEQTHAKVPWEKSFAAVPGQFLYVSAQNSGDYGKVKCELLVNGVVVKQAESSGAYKIVDCSGRL